MRPVTKELAALIVETPPDAVSGELRRRAEVIVIDTFGAILAGAGSEAAQPLLRYAGTQGGHGQIPILGTTVETSPEVAAFVNGSFGHALEYDDVFSMMPGHPAAVILAALIGDAAAHATSGHDLTDAFVVGYETAARMGVAITLEHHRVRHFHATATLGIFGAAAALARLRRYDVPGTARTLSVAASFASGLLGQTGSMMKPVHSGWAARNAVAAADLIRSGLGSVEDLLEAPRGFFSAYGTATSRVDRLVEGFGTPWGMLSPGVSLKKYPCCFAAHRGIEAVLNLRRTHGIGFDDVAAIECRLPPKGLVNMVYNRPQTGLQAKFSMEYCFLAALLDGEATLASFTDAAVLRPTIQKNLGLVACREDPACEEGIGEASGEISGARGFVEIAIVTRDGERLVDRVAQAPGTPARPMTTDDLREKIGICARHAGLGVDQTSMLVETLLVYPTAPDLGALLASFRPRAAAPAALHA